MANEKTYLAKVRYSYSVDGTPYTGGKVSFSQYGGRQEHSRQIVQQYPVGKAVDVYYDPEKPETAVLEPGVTNSSYLILGIGLLSTICGIAAFLWKK